MNLRSVPMNFRFQSPQEIDHAVGGYPGYPGYLPEIQGRRNGRSSLSMNMSDSSPSKFVKTAKTDT